MIIKEASMIILAQTVPGIFYKVHILGYIDYRNNWHINMSFLMSVFSSLTIWTSGMLAENMKAESEKWDLWFDMICWLKAWTPIRHTYIRMKSA